MKVTFWGVRGSVPASLTNADVAALVDGFITGLPADMTRATAQDALWARLQGGPVFTHGGNTSCVSVVAGDELIVLDMGTGLRMLGNQLIGHIVQAKEYRATFLISHVHWDHIQGLPFFKPLYLNRHDGYRNQWTFYGGTEWYEHAEACLRGQMDPPHFPVSWKEIEKLTERLQCSSVHDGLVLQVPDRAVVNTDPDKTAIVTCRKLDHPQETYGYRIEFGGKVVAYTTDHEPRDRDMPYRNLLRLIDGADLWITDCQYSRHQYIGKDGPQRYGWGHSYPEPIARAAALGKVKQVVTFHHDPDNDAAAIARIAADVGAILPVPAVAAHEGMVIEV